MTKGDFDIRYMTYFFIPSFTNKNNKVLKLSINKLWNKKQKSMKL